MEYKSLSRRHKNVLLSGLFFILGALGPFTACFAADPAPGGSVQQVEVTVIHVDQYAVYGPKLIFYFDPQMDKRKISALTRTADQLRNKKAMITYSSKGEAGQDKRAMLLDISSATDRHGAEKPTHDSHGPAEDMYAKTPGAETPQTGYEPAHRQPPYQAVPDKKPAQAPGQPAQAEPQPPVRQPSGQEKRPVTGQVPAQEQYSSAQPAGQERKPARSGVPPSSFEPPVPSRQPVGQEKKPLPPAGRTAPLEQQVPPKQAAVQDRKPSPPDVQPAPITRDEVTGFVRRILDLNGRKDLTAIMPLYAEKVDYYDRGAVSNDYVRRDLIYYFRNWDRITTSLDGDVVMIVLEPEVRIAKFVTSYSVKNDKKALTGKTENIWKIQRMNGQLKIIDVKQKNFARGPSGTTQ